MKNIIVLLAILVLFISANTPDNNTVVVTKPAIPKSVIVKDFDWNYRNTDVAKFVREKIKEGYITKTITVSALGTSTEYWLVVMEKY